MEESQTPGDGVMSLDEANKLADDTLQWEEPDSGVTRIESLQKEIQAHDGDDENEWYVAELQKAINVIRASKKKGGGSIVSLRQRLSLVPARRDELNELAEIYHYMHRPVHQRASPFGWRVELDGRVNDGKNFPYGFIIFASIHFTRLRGEFGYVGLPTKWQVLSLSRLWLNDCLPKNSATCVISKSLKLVQRRWLEVHPPKYLDEPYHVEKIISYADTRFHRGTVYRAANFRESGRTISKFRHKNTRGSGMNGAELIRFIYDLPQPNWQYRPIQPSLF